MTQNANERKVILDLAVTLDGLIEGKNGEIDWCIMDDEMDFTSFLNRIDTIFYGRKSYDLWGNYVPEIDASHSEREMWDIVHSKEKFVFSKTQKGSNQEAIYINDDIQEEVHRLKREPGKDIWLYGGSSLITTFIHLGLVDEYRLSIHPLILGEGKPLFVEIKERNHLKLVDSKTFSSGVVQLIYHVNKDW